MNKISWQTWGRSIGACVLSGLSASLLAQNIDLETANSYYSSSLFKEAIPAYERALEREPQNAKAKVHLAECYRFVNNLPKALVWYAQAVQHPENKKYILDYAQTLRGNRQYDEAKSWFVRYAQEVDSTKGFHFATVCDFAKQNGVSNTPLFKVENMEAINSKNADFAPTFYKDQVIFASSRSVAVEKNGSVTWTNDAFNQCYTATADAAGTLTNPKPLRNFIGKDINDAPLAFSKDGNWVAITSNNFMDGIRHIDGSGMMMDIYFCEALSMREWRQGSEQFFTYNATVDAETPFSTGQPFITERGDAIYFASNRPGGMGGYDIYVAFKTQRGWTVPKNLGYPINTAGNEMCPFIDSYGRLYFSSDWHAGFGGMDIFTAERLPFGWANVQNVGAEVNSAADELYFSFDSQKRVGYFASNRAGGKGNEDIYKATQLRSYTNRPRQSIQLGEQLAFRYMQFGDNNEITFTNPAEQELMYRLLLALHDNPDVVIQAYAYTDARGMASANLETSQKRARSLANYLMNSGINSNRISFGGYGENYPLNNCVDGATCSDAEHFLNRRIEITLVGRIDETGSVALKYDATPLPMPTAARSSSRSRSKSKSKSRSRSSQPKISVPSPDRTKPREIGTGGKVIFATTEIKPSVTEPTKSTTEPTKTTTVEPTKPTKTVSDVAKSTTEEPRTRKPIRKEHYAIGEKIDIANIYYDHDKSSIDEKKSPGLKEILEVMIDQPYIVIEIGSHTDANGDDDYNRKLSEKRAESVKAYLVKKGIPAARLVAKGYGESQLLNKCKDGTKCSDAEHAENRRTEFKVTAQKGLKDRRCDTSG